MADRIIQTADLSIIERNLQIVGSKLQDIEDNVGSVDHKVVALNNELAALAREFEEYVVAQGKANLLPRRRHALFSLTMSSTRSTGIMMLSADRLRVFFRQMTWVWSASRRLILYQRS